MTFSWSLGRRRLAVLEADHNAYNEVRGNIRENSSERVRSGLFEVIYVKKKEKWHILTIQLFFFGEFFYRLDEGLWGSCYKPFRVWSNVYIFLYTCSCRVKSNLLKSRHTDLYQELQHLFPRILLERPNWHTDAPLGVKGSLLYPNSSMSFSQDVFQVSNLLGKVESNLGSSVKKPCVF